MEELSSEFDSANTEGFQVINFSDLDFEPEQEVLIPNPNARFERLMSRLKTREQTVIEARIGLGERKLTLREIGPLIGGVSPERVRQIQKRAFRKMEPAIVRERRRTASDLKNKEIKDEPFSDLEIIKNVQLGLTSSEYKHTQNPPVDAISGVSELGRFNISILNLSPRALGALIEADLSSIRELKNLSAEEIKTRSKIGDISLREISEKLTYAEKLASAYTRKMVNVENLDQSENKPEPEPVSEASAQPNKYKTATGFDLEALLEDLKVLETQRKRPAFKRLFDYIKSLFRRS